MKQVVYLLSLSLLLSCSKRTAMKTFDVSLDADFTELFFDSHFEVILTQATENQLTVECTEHTFSKLTFTLENNTLRIKNRAKFAWGRPKKNDVKLYLSVKNLSKIYANETCKISTNGPLISDDLGLIFASKLNEADLELDCKTFYYWNNFPCGGKLSLRGKVDFLKVWNFALMQVDATNCLAKQVLVENSSKGDCSFRAIEQIDYSIHGEGNVNCYGQPAKVIATKLDGKGQFSLK